MSSFRAPKGFLTGRQLLRGMLRPARSSATSTSSFRVESEDTQGMYRPFRHIWRREREREREKKKEKREKEMWEGGGERRVRVRGKEGAVILNVQGE